MPIQNPQEEFEFDELVLGQENQIFNLFLVYVFSSYCWYPWRELDKKHVEVEKRFSRKKGGKTTRKEKQ